MEPGLTQEVIKCAPSAPHPFLEAPSPHRQGRWQYFPRGLTGRKEEPPNFCLSGFVRATLRNPGSGSEAVLLPPQELAAGRMLKGQEGSANLPQCITLLELELGVFRRSWLPVGPTAHLLSWKQGGLLSFAPPRARAGFLSLCIQGAY